MAEAYLMTPMFGRGEIHSVYPFNNDTIIEVVPENAMCGNYQIGCVIKVGDALEFRTCYFGRSGQNGTALRERIISHLIENQENERHVYDDTHFFMFECHDQNNEPGVDANQLAYARELSDYETYFDSRGLRHLGNGFTDNERYSHDGNRQQPSTDNSTVYVDNLVRPARP